MLVTMVMTAAAQKIIVKDFTVLPTDAKAANDQRLAADGTPCALVRVDVVGVKDMTFKEAVGTVDYSVGEYLVYIPNGTKKLNYTYGGSQRGAIDFDDLGYSIDKLTTYRLQFETQDKLRSAVFSVAPVKARLIVNGKTVTLDDNGLAEVELPIGDYSYSVTANGYNSEQGTVKLTEERVATVTTVNLEQRTYDFYISSNVATANVFIDDVSYGTISTKPIALPEGTHKVRVSAEKYEDYTEEVTIDGTRKSMYATLKEMKIKTVEYNDERTRTKVNIRNAGYFLVGASLYDKDKYSEFDEYMASANIQLHYMFHMFGAFAIQTGMEIGWLFTEDQWEEDNDATSSLNLMLPVQAGISVPFGKYNRNLISILGGGYGGITYLLDDSETDATEFDYGLRATLRIDLNHFTVSADLNQSLNDRGFFAGVTLGYKFYFKK